MKQGRKTRSRGQADDRRKRVPAAPSPPAGASADLMSRWAILGLAALTWLISLPMFEPQSFWPAGYLVLVPWAVAVRAAGRTRWLYLTSFLLGAAFFLTHFRWLYSTTPEGFVLGSLYLALTFPLAAWLIRHLCRRRGLSVIIALPVVWVGLELIRSRGPLAFPWFLLGHSQVRLTTMIQIADLAGACGVSFVVALVNGWLADVLVRWRASRRDPSAGIRPIRPAVSAAVLGVVLVTAVYGRVRIAQTPEDKGPRIAVIQGDFTLSPDRGRVTPTEGQKAAQYRDLLAEAARDKPDMFVLPETPWSLYLNRELRESPAQSVLTELSRLQHRQFVNLVERYRAYIVVGSLSIERHPERVYPQEDKYNSAFVYAPCGPDGKVPEPGRYDKCHLVLFGEYVPFRYSRRLFRLYRFLNDGPWNPWGQGGVEYSLTPGDSFDTFEIRPRSGAARESYRFGITICYEDVIPQVFRRFVVSPAGHKQVDFMLNISNDGWFGHGTQQAQHLASCAFRAVENRVGVARAVNTGVSGFIDPAGRWYDLVSPSNARPTAGGNGYRIAHVRTDPRLTVYSVHGDVFAWACLVLTLLAGVDAIVGRMASRRPRVKTDDEVTA